MKKLYVVEVNHSHIRTVNSDKHLFVGDTIADETWLGHNVAGGIITNIYKDSKPVQTHCWVCGKSCTLNDSREECPGYRICNDCDDEK